MTIYERFANAYRSGGIREVARKLIFHYIYRINNYFSKLFVHLKKIEYGLNRKDREDHIIISLTSFPMRFAHIDLCLKSLLMQSLKPDKIIVYLGSDTDESQITEAMNELKQYGVEYQIDKSKNLRAHKKYFYAMQEYPDSIIVTADDDLIYPRNWLLSLYNSYQMHPQAISARRVHLMKKMGNGLAPYNSWEDQCRRIRTESFALFATGGSGKLYPPHCLCKETFAVDKIVNLCYAADDIWLKCMEILSGIPVVWVNNWEVDQLGVEEKQEVALSNENVDLGVNDLYFNSLLSEYNIDVKKIFEM